MNTVRITTGTPYDVRIGEGITDTVGAALRACPALSGASRVMLVSDSRVASLHSDSIAAQIAGAGYPVDRFVFPEGEGHKTLETLDGLLRSLYAADFSHTDCLVAVGGGLVGDVTGLAAALYCRGTPFVQIPTSLLAAVDASVGGKTAVNLCGAKNQIGCFHQPSLVLCDTNLLKTLPPARMAEGMAEIIKYGMIADASLLDTVSPVRDLTAVITACVKIKASLVEQDEFDAGVRRLLNFGHTFGHAVEYVSDHAVSHGDAVAAGMCIATRAAARAGLCGADVIGTLERHLSFYHLPTGTDLPYDALCAAMRHDKKRAGGTLTLILPVRVGRCVTHTLPIDALVGFFLPSDARCAGL